MIKRFIISVAIMCATVSSMATTLDVSNLSKEQIDQVTAQVKALKDTSAPNVSAQIRQEATAWGELGGNIGKAMVGAAKEIGVAANEFSQTDLGKVVTVIVVYKLIGLTLTKLVIGCCVMLFGCPFSIWILRTTFGTRKTYEYKPYLFGMWNRKIVTSSNEDSDFTVFRVIIGCVAMILTFIVGLNVIF